VDYNRAGMPLIEIVTAPEIRSGKEAAMVFRKIQKLLQEINVCSGSLEEVRSELSETSV
jgi:aspartyl-tRNA(Asn)/glutamyl-tRNA(Gln) amidotransferase subunit B